MKIQVLKGKAWYWRLLALNGKCLATSETYSSKKNAIKVAENVFTNMKRCHIEILPPGIKDIKLPKNWGKIK